MRFSPLPHLLSLSPLALNSWPQADGLQGVRTSTLTFSSQAGLDLCGFRGEGQAKRLGYHYLPLVPPRNCAKVEHHISIRTSVCRRKGRRITPRPHRPPPPSTIHPAFLPPTSSREVLIGLICAHRYDSMYVFVPC